MDTWSCFFLEKRFFLVMLNGGALKTSEGASQKITGAPYITVPCVVVHACRFVGVLVCGSFGVAAPPKCSNVLYTYKVRSFSHTAGGATRRLANWDTSIV